MAAAIPPLRIVALNDSVNSENRIHSDDIASRYGFRGALVSGANVFGYLCQSLVHGFGEDWFSGTVAEVRFLKPAYENDEIHVLHQAESDGPDQRQFLSRACNQDQELLAELKSRAPAEMPPVSELAPLAGADSDGERQQISWDLVHPMQASAVYRWQPTARDNARRLESQRDPNRIYRGEDGLLHPYYLLRASNRALMRMFILPAWIHTGSRLILRKPLRAGQTISVHAVIRDKWERKGHQFLTLYVAMWEGNEVAVEVDHTAIFRIAD